jgi:iron-sulfur cluster assembly 1
MPPRNKDAPETTITSPPIRRTELGNKVQAEQQSPQTAGPSKHTSSDTVTETEAQQPKPVAEAPKPKRRSKLRARKAAMKISETAVTHLRDLLDQPTPQLIRVGVKNRGCSGLAYHLEYVDKAAPFDEVVEQDGVQVLIDSKALFSIIGSEMDWEEDQLSARFVFRNPNITEQCGCGESFSVS